MPSGTPVDDKLESKRDLFKAVEVPDGLHDDASRALKACALCGGREVKRLYMQAHFPVVKCRGCGLVYADEHFQDKDLEAFYSGDYYQRAYVCHPPEIDAKIAADYVRAFDRVDRKLKGGKVLDFGSARGTFIAELLARGYDDRWEALGIDINADEVAMGLEKNLPLLASDLDGAGFEPGSFDAITAFSVMEHLQAPQGFVDDFARLLRPGGELLFIVPAGNCLILDVAILAGRLLGNRVRGFTDNVFHEEHLYYFTRRTMRRLLEPRGFQVREFFFTPSYLETHPPSPLVAVGAYGLRLASFLTRRQTMLGVVATRTED